MQLVLMKYKGKKKLITPKMLTQEEIKFAEFYCVGECIDGTRCMAKAYFVKGSRRSKSYFSSDNHQKTCDQNHQGYRNITQCEIIYDFKRILDAKNNDLDEPKTDKSIESKALITSESSSNDTNEITIYKMAKLHVATAKLWFAWANTVRLDTLIDERTTISSFYLNRETQNRFLDEEMKGIIAAELSKLNAIEYLQFKSEREKMCFLAKFPVKFNNKIVLVNIFLNNKILNGILVSKLTAQREEFENICIITDTWQKIKENECSIIYRAVIHNNRAICLMNKINGEKVYMGVRRK